MPDRKVSTSEKIKIRPVGRVKVERLERTSSHARESIIEIFPEYKDALVGLKGFSHIFVVFKSHSTAKGNLIGFELAKIVRIEQNKLVVSGLECVDRTPILDIRAYDESYRPEQYGCRIDSKSRPTRL